MWDIIENDFEIECGGECQFEAPPEFLIPPPPIPPFLEITRCADCESIFDASYYNNTSLQVSAMVLLCSVLLLIFISISSLLIWKHKRKVQNFLPCKTPTRGPLNGPGLSGLSGHSAIYEDPDLHYGHHRPLVVRHPLSADVLHAKTLHYPSGFPIPNSPPLFICSSPGPDPYRSNDNVYEELQHRRDSDSELHMQSDDDFAEDELSLPDRSINKSSPDNTTVATISNASNILPEISNSQMFAAERTAASVAIDKSNNCNSISNNLNLNDKRTNRRNSSLSSDSNNNSSCVGSSSTSNQTMRNFRSRTSRPNNKSNTNSKHCRPKPNNYSMDNLNNGNLAMGTSERNPSLFSDKFSNVNSFNYSSVPPDTSDDVCNNNTNLNVNEVERLNYLNAQLSSNVPATLYHNHNRNNVRNYPMTLAHQTFLNNCYGERSSMTNPRNFNHSSQSNHTNTLNNNQYEAYHPYIVKYNNSNGNSANNNPNEPPPTNNHPEEDRWRYQPVMIDSDSGYSNNSNRSYWGRRKQRDNSSTLSNRNEARLEGS